MSLVKRKDIAAEARTWVGVRYRHLGRNRDGIDCVGLILKVAEPFDLHTYPDKIAYSRDSRGHELLQPFKEHMDRVLLRDVGNGDVVMFKSGPYPHHCGIVVTDDSDGRRYIVHAEAHARKVSITAMEIMVDSAIMAFRFRGTE